MHVIIGIITGTHGVNGEVEVKTYSHFKHARYQRGNVLYARKRTGRIPLTVVTHKEKKGRDVLGFEEIDSLEEASTFKNVDLEIPREAREALEEDAYYYDELIGFDVYQGDIHKGRIKNVFEVPQGAMLRVARDGRKDALVPFLKAYVEHVDQTRRRVDLVDLEGLL